jgi:DNA (cytosine-5)-methyltransferase 1
LENIASERQNILAGGAGSGITSGRQELGTAIASSEDSRSRRIRPEGNGTGGEPETEPAQPGEPHFKCVWYCDIDRHAVQTYDKNFKESYGPTDVRTVAPESIPDFDLLCAGFPCQSFSIAGKRRGFQDTRGTLFFEIARIAQVKRPRLLLLENVKGLLSHDEGRTFGTILAVLDELGYDAEWEVLNSKHFGVPQNRERVFVVGHLRGEPWREVFPLGEGDTRPDETKGEEQERRPRFRGGVSPTIGARYGRSTNGGEPFIIRLDDNESIEHRLYSRDGLSPSLPTGATGGNLIPKIADAVDPDRYLRYEHRLMLAQITRKRIRIRKLTPVECERLQGFPDGWTAGVSDTQRYKLMGNAVTVNVVEAIGRAILDATATAEGSEAGVSG